MCHAVGVKSNASAAGLHTQRQRQIIGLPSSNCFELANLLFHCLGLCLQIMEIFFQPGNTLLACVESAVEVSVMPARAVTATTAVVMPGTAPFVTTAVPIMLFFVVCAVMPFSVAAIVTTTVMFVLTHTLLPPLLKMCFVYR